MNCLQENPWDRLRYIQQKIIQTPLQATFNVSSLNSNQSMRTSSIQDLISHCFCNGIYVFRLYDLQNNFNKLRPYIEAVKDTSAQVQAALIINSKLIDSPETMLDIVKSLEDLGIDSLCLQDESGLLTTTNVMKIVSRIKEKFSFPLQLHTHYNGSMALGICLKAVESGIDYLDAVSSPLAFGLSLPPVESLVYSLKDGKLDTGINANLLFELANYFEDMRKEFNFPRIITRLEDLKTIGQDKYAEDLILFDKNTIELSKNLSLADEDVALIQQQDEEIKLIYAWFPTVELEYLKEAGKLKLDTTSLDLDGSSVSTADDTVIFQEEEVIGAMKINELREILKMLDGTEVTELSLDTSDFKVHIKRDPTISSVQLPTLAEKSIPNDKETEPALDITLIEELVNLPVQTEARSAAAATQILPVASPIIGRLYRSANPGNPPFVEVGTRVSSGQVLCIIEAMKVMNEVVAEVSGMVAEILIDNGKPVQYGETIMLIAREVTA
jgi:acetyl-CoA carboxylase biotin carboxyl carrier protein